MLGQDSYSSAVALMVRLRSPSILSESRAGSRGSRRIDFLLARDLAQENFDGIVKLVNHAFLERNDGVVGDVNVFGTNLGAAFGDVAEADSRVILEQFGAIKTVHRMHLKACEHV